MWTVALVQAALGLGLLAGVTTLTSRWPFEGTTPLTFTFVASILLAAAASTAWCVLADEPAGLAGVGLDYLAILVPLLVVLLVADVEDRWTLVGAVLPTLVFGVWMVVVFGRLPAQERPTPAPVRWAFVGFAAALVVVAGALFAGRDILPWPVTRQLGVVVGIMFLGAAAYFVFGAVRARWTHAGGQLAGFLAYDLVLIGPLAARVPDVTEEDAVSLAVYLAVIVSSGLLAAWYLGRPPTGSRSGV